MRTTGQIFIQGKCRTTAVDSITTRINVNEATLRCCCEAGRVLFSTVFKRLLSSLLPGVSQILSRGDAVLRGVPIVISLCVKVIHTGPVFPGFIINRLGESPRHLFRAILGSPGGVRPVLHLHHRVRRRVSGKLLQGVPIVSLISALIDLIIFPLLVHGPLTTTFLSGSVKQFRRCVSEHESLVIRMVARLVIPSTE